MIQFTQLIEFGWNINSKMNRNGEWEYPAYIPKEGEFLITSSQFLEMPRETCHHHGAGVNSNLLGGHSMAGEYSKWKTFGYIGLRLSLASGRLLMNMKQDFIFTVNTMEHGLLPPRYHTSSGHMR